MYIFSVGQRITDGNKFGMITSMVPGNGRPESEWYYVEWDDGTTDRYMRNQLQPA